MARKAKSHTMIKDPLLEPYFVTKMIIVTPLTKIYKKTLITLELKEQTEKSYDKALTFHSNLGQALKCYF